MSIRTAYKEIVARDNLTDDPGQARVVDMLDDLQSSLQATSSKRSWLPGWLAFRNSGSTKPIDGLYIWGGVGRGKTFLMDLFFDTLAVERKRRVHFHRMMSEIHDRLKSLEDIEDPMEQVADGISQDIDVLCFDEFFVSDIADAMILGKLLDALFTRGVTMIATSNVRPAELYATGLQRDRFLPAISLLEKHTRIVELDGGTDYRLRLLQKSGTYITPSDQAAHDRFEQYFTELAPGRIIEKHALDILGRKIRTLRCAKGVAWFDFAELCDGPRSQQDYIELARWYQTVIVSDVPVLDARQEDAARRFIALVDEFYDRKVKLLLSAEAPVSNLYQGRRLDFEFRRTESRLMEMQTSEYLHTAHIA